MLTHHPSLIKYNDTQSRDRLYKLCLDLKREDKYNKVNYEYIVREGDVSWNLKTIITEQNIDLVVFSIEGEVKPENPYYGNVFSEII